MIKPVRPKSVAPRPVLLCVEDDLEWQELVKNNLNKAFSDVDIIFAADLESATNILQTQTVAIVVTDISYPLSAGEHQDTTAGVKFITTALLNHLHSIRGIIATTSNVSDSREKLKSVSAHYRAEKGVNPPLLDKNTNEFFPDLIRHVRKVLAAQSPAPKAAKELRS
jgi:CheY-like chemotaxis protein